MRLSIDVGGTFTDLVLLDDAGSRLLTDKLPSTPDSGRAVVDGIARIAARAGVTPHALEIVFHGFTIATNAWLTRSGARVALLVTEGYGDILAIGSQRRPHTYDLTARKPQPLVPRSQVIEVRERLDAFGQVVQPLLDDEIARVVDAVTALAPESVAISLLFSWAGAGHEERLRDALARACPGLPVYCSSEVDPRIEEYPRTNTTAAAAYVGPRVDTYTRALEADLAQAGVRAPLLYMRSDGGAATARSARANPASMLLSGPAGGVVAALALGEALGVRNLINFDMGGTSADFSVVREGEAGRVLERDLDGLPLRVPMLEINAISAGGGSIAWVDRGGALRVGPDSAGAVPGPACYGKGGTAPTLTDAALALGFLDADWFAGGELSLDPALAGEAIRAQVSDPLGLSVEAAALGMFQVATANMAQAIRELSTERGDDVAEFSLLAFGGAGGLFAPFLLRELGLREVLVPTVPGVFAALGLLHADLRHHTQTAFTASLRNLGPDALAEALRALEAALHEALEADGVARRDRRLSFSADMRYAGQHHQLEVALGAAGALDVAAVAALADAFHEAHERRYGYCHRGSEVELTNLHGVAEGLQPRPPAVHPDRLDGPAVAFAERELPLGEGQRRVAARLYRRRELGPGRCADGPAVVVQGDSTLLVLAGQRATADRLGVLHVTE